MTGVGDRKSVVRGGRGDVGGRGGCNVDMTGVGDQQRGAQGRSACVGGGHVQDEDPRRHVAPRCSHTHSTTASCG